MSGSMKFDTSECGPCGVITTHERPVRGGAVFTCSGCGTLLLQPNEFKAKAVSFHARMHERVSDWPLDGQGDPAILDGAEDFKRIPKRARYGSRIYDVLHYAGRGCFVLRDGDARVTVPRTRLTFIKD